MFVSMCAVQNVHVYDMYHTLLLVNAADCSDIYNTVAINT